MGETLLDDLIPLKEEFDNLPEDPFLDNMERHEKPNPRKPAPSKQRVVKKRITKLLKSQAQPNA